MSRTENQERRLREAKILLGMLADRMMAAYALGGAPTPTQIQALCRAVLLLEAHGTALPPFVDAVIARLAAQDEEPAASPSPSPPARRAGLLGRVLQPLRRPAA